MWSAIRQPIRASAALLGLALLAACGTDEQRPKPKPEHLTVQLPSSDRPGAQLTRARISTKSGEILILEPDGAVTPLDLGSAEGQDAFNVTEAELMALNSNLNLHLPGGPASNDRPPEMTAQQRALKDFAARTQPALPTWRAGTEVAPEDFLGARVDVLNKDGAGDLVEVTANLREDATADIAFSYATCALAGWAKATGANYGRHIRTLQDTRDGKLLIGAAFTISQKKPLGLRVMETEQTLRDCKARGIPAT